MKKFIATFVFTLFSFELYAENTISGDSCAKLKPTDNCTINMNPGQLCLGTDEDDIIIGSSGNDIIITSAGMDRVIAGEGNDIVCGGDGVDTIFGDSGDDILDAGEGKDFLSGAEGNDTCIGGGVASNCENILKKSIVIEDKCKLIIGKWHWFDNGMVHFTDDNKVQWHEPMTVRKGHHAEWKCDAKTGIVTIPWSNGFTDKMSVISNGSSLQGKNNRGMTIWAQRVPEDF